MCQRLFIKILGLFCLLFINQGFAKYGLSMASGYGTSSIVPLRLGALQTWDKHWREGKTWRVTGYWEGSYYRMYGNSNSQLDVLLAAGVFRFWQQLGQKTQAVVDLGLGGSYVSKREIGGRELGIHFQFEDRLGLGMIFKKKYEIGYRATHFSNAYISGKNHGINLHIIYFTYWLC